MRITNKTLSSNFLNNLNKNAGQLSKLQKQLASGKQIEKPSDDPIGVAKIMNLTRDVDIREQYTKNMDDSIGWNNMTDTAMENISNSLQRLREITVQAANATYSGSDKQQLLEEADQLIEQIAQDGNTMYDGRYIFAGNKIKTPPFELSAGELVYSGDEGDMMVEVSNSLNVKINTTGKEFENSAKLSDTLKSLKEALASGDEEKLSGEVLSNMDDALEGILNQRAKVGARTNRFKSIKEKSDAETLNIKEILSKTQDIDVAEKIMEFMTMQSIYQATLSTGAKVIQPTLLDYIR